MNQFFKVLSFLNERFYQPNRLMIKNIQEEGQNSNYGAGTFQLNAKTVRFRVAKVTPNKKGQFVALWEKDANNKNQAFSIANATDLLVIHTFGSNNQLGQFIFPKGTLLKYNILKTDTSKGKMAIRVYPSWDTPNSKQAIETQVWQLPYFLNLNNANSIYIKKFY